MSATYPQFPHSNFPDSLDSWEDFKDVTSTDGALLTQYQQYVLAGDMENAQTVYEQITDAKNKIIGALTLNQFSDSIQALENFYQSDGSGFTAYTTTKQAEWQTIINRFAYIGVYNASIQYYRNNIVSYTQNGKTYLYINTYNGTTPVGTIPTNTSYWRLFTVQGQQGESATGSTVFCFQWDSATTYQANNIVSSGSSLYIALQESTNIKPQNNPTYWEKIFTVPQKSYPVQAEEPSGLSSGDLWFRIVS